MFLTLCLDDANVEMTCRFYGRLGCDFAPEKHGDRGLPHYAAIVPSVPVEVYPTMKSMPPEDRLFIGFTVESPESVKAALIEQFGGSETKLPVPATKSGIATLRDPNGILVRLFPKV